MELNFLKDKEINLEKSDLLGTKPYVNTIIEIIKKAETPFTIGLFGSWGTGKSSIIETLKNKLNQDNKSNIFVFKYDAWKYSRDSFRRTFILDLKKELEISGTAKLNSFYQEETKDEEIKSRFNLKYCIYVTIFSIVIIFSILFLAKIFKLTSNLELTIPIVISFIALFISFFRNVFTDYKISIKKPIIFAPEQFENVFKEIVCKIADEKCSNEYIKNIRGIKNKIDKIVIVIDNIDRCHKDNAFELLLTIKSFLEQKKVIFVIPIDETEIKKHIEEKEHNGNEFLRKLFNTTITIKMFSESDLFDFAKKLNDKHKLNFSGEVISLISQKFSKNPRKIIQFLNVLQTEIYLAEEQEIKGNIPKGSITNNLPFLTKTLLIREEWPDVYEELKENPYWLNEIDSQLKGDTNKIVIGNTELTNEQCNFFSRTSHISSNMFEEFFINKDSFLNIPDEVNKLVESQDWGSIKKLIEKKIISIEKLIEFIDQKYEKDINKRNLLKTTGVNLFSLIFKIANDKDFTKIFLKYFYGNYSFFGKIKAYLNSIKISELLLDFDSILLINFVKTDLQQNNFLLKEIIKVINKTDQGTYNLLRQFIVAFKNDPIILENINMRFSEILTKEPTLYIDFKDVLNDSKVVESLIKPELLEGFINKFVQNPNTEEDKSKIEIIKNYHLLKGLSPKLIKQFIEKILSFLNSTSDLAILSFWLKNIKDLINNVQKDDETMKNSIFDTLNKKNTFLQQQYDSLWNKADYQTVLQYFLEVACEFYLLTMASKLEINIWLTNFFKRNENANILLHINMLFQKIINYFETFDWPFSQQIIDKYKEITDWENKIKIAKTINLMLTKTSDKKGLKESQIQVILIKFIDDLNGDNSKTIKEWLSSGIKNTIIKEQLKKVIEKLTNNKKLDILEIIKEIDKDLIEECVEEIFANTDCKDLESTYQKIEMAKISSSLMKNSIKKALKKLQKENKEEYSKCFIKYILDKKIVDKNIELEIITIITPFLSNSQEPKEKKMFALHVLERIDIPKNKKGLIKALLKEIDDKEFNSDEKTLLKKMKKKK